MGLHDRHKEFTEFSQFENHVLQVPEPSLLINECILLVKTLGIIEPISNIYIPPDQISVDKSNIRESIVANQLISRNRAILYVLSHLFDQKLFNSTLKVYTPELISSWSAWLVNLFGKENVTLSEYLSDCDLNIDENHHQDLCNLSFSSESFDLVLVNEVFEHVRDLEQAFREINRILKAKGVVLATTPLAYGQFDSIIKAKYNQDSGEVIYLSEPEFHGDPIRPEKGSLVYQIPGWEILNMADASGFHSAKFHYITSWKYGILGADLPGVLVFQAEKLD